jgi:hypothetical protein
MKGLFFLMPINVSATFFLKKEVLLMQGTNHENLLCMLLLVAITDLQCDTPCKHYAFSEHSKAMRSHK